MDLSLNSHYSENFLAHVQSSMRGEVTYIPIQLDRVGDTFNLMQSRYTLISGATGAGKTSLADYIYILSTFRYLKKLEEDIHWEVLYYSLERKTMFKHAKWISWLIYKDHNILISADELLGWGKNPLNEEGYKLLRSYDDEISELLEHVDIHDGKTKPKVIIDSVIRKARALGTLYYTNTLGLYVDDNPLPIKTFREHGKVKHTKLGDKKYITHSHKGTDFVLFEDGHKYFLNNPKTFMFIVLDGINLLGKKDELDQLSTDLAGIRDIYGFSPVVVTQQNRAMGDVTRMKLHGKDLSPQIEDIFKSSQMGFDADLILGLFDPYRYKAYDNEGKYGGYIINPPTDTIQTQSMLSPKGFSRFRSLHVLKNSFGPDGLRVGMKFLGESNHFDILPLPDDPKMNTIYADIMRGI